MRRTLPLFFAVIFAFGMVDGLSMPSLLRGSLTQYSWLERTVLFSLLIGSWSVWLMPALAKTIRAPGVVWLQREPLTHVQWALVMGIVLVPLCFPLAYPAFLFASPTASGLEMLGTVLIAGQLTVQRYTLTQKRWVLAFGASAFATIALDQRFGLWGLPVFFAGVCGLVLPLRFRYGIASTGRQNPDSRGSSWQARPVVALLRRDYLAMATSSRLWWLSMFSWLVPAAGLLWALRVNGGLAPGPLLLAFVVLFAVTTIPVLSWMEAVRLRLGIQFLQRRWPVTVTQKWISLLTFSGLACGVQGAMLMITARFPPEYMAVAFLWMICLVALIPLMVTWRFLYARKDPGEAPYIMSLVALGLLFTLPTGVLLPAMIFIVVMALLSGNVILRRWRKST